MKAAGQDSSRDRLLTAGKTLFAERGYEATTTAAIAKAAGTSHSQLVKHFKDKQGNIVGWIDNLGQLFAKSFNIVNLGQVIAKLDEFGALHPRG